MAFNDSLDFEPSVAKLRGQSDLFHVILSGYLRSSKTFELYAALQRKQGLPSRLLPFELKGDQESQVSETLVQLFRFLKSEPKFQSIMVSDPFKRVVHDLVDEVSDAARDCGAINVVLKVNGRLIGDNFDGHAFVSGAMDQSDIDFRDRSMVFFGCGGVSSAVATELAPVLRRVGLVDLQAAQAQALKEILTRKNSALEVDIIPPEGGRDFRVYEYVYNGTGLGKFNQFSPVLPDDLFASTGIAFDANYTPASTPFLKQLKALGFRAVNGLSHMMMCTSMHLSAATSDAVPFDMVRLAYEEISQTTPL
jgi:shikimate dehydrogenase